ncbi:MAG TPA: HAMP domain-containing protein, partial [Candidatus Baltobacteraceae bacterium]|nr:HAMP domain-containing protein [Candidatus Baltobacteraceae bacterium]
MALLLVSAGFIVYDQQTFRREMVDDMTTTAQMAGGLSHGYLSFGGTEKDAAQIWEALTHKQHIEAAVLYKGTNLASAYFRDKNITRIVPMHPAKAGWQFGNGRLEGFEPIQLNDQIIGAIYLQSDLSALHSRLAQYLGMVGILIAASSILVYLLSLQLQRIITRPVFQLARTAKTISVAKNYSVRARKESNDEFGQLIDGFNEMLDQIQRRDAALHRVNVELEKAREELEIRVEQRTKELREAQKIVMQQERLKALGQMASGIAHDVNNALSPIMGFADLIQVCESNLSE